MPSATKEQMKGHLDACHTHIRLVQKYIGQMIKQLVDRAVKHDQSKLVEPEASGYASVWPKLETVVWGSKEDTEIREQIGAYTELHWKINRHHPQYFENGIAGMNLLDLLEALCDWKSAHDKKGQGMPFEDSVETAIKKFEICPQTASIIRNSLALFKEPNGNA